MPFSFCGCCQQPSAAVSLSGKASATQQPCPRPYPFSGDSFHSAVSQVGISKPSHNSDGGFQLHSPTGVHQACITAPCLSPAIFLPCPLINILHTDLPLSLLQGNSAFNSLQSTESPAPLRDSSEPCGRGLSIFFANWSVLTGHQHWCGTDESSKHPLAPSYDPHHIAGVDSANAMPSVL